MVGSSDNIQKESTLHLNYDGVEKRSARNIWALFLEKRLDTQPANQQESVASQL
jgi:hypothetical protein